MDDVWNDSSLIRPPICTVKTKINPQRIKELKSVLNDYVVVFPFSEILEKEAALLSRLLYKVKSSYRHDKWTKALCKIMKCMRTNKELNINKLILEFKESLPNDITISTKHTFLPTNQNFKYLLLRLQTYSKLLLRLYVTCEEAGKYIILRLRLKWNIQVLLLAFCIISRIWTVVQYLLKRCLAWYDQLVPFMNCFSQTNTFLEGYVFVRCLKEWLGVDLEEPNRVKTRVERLFSVINLESDEDDIMQIILSENEEEDKVEVVDSDCEVVEEVKNTLKRKLEEDIGEQVSREPVIEKKKKKKKKRAN